MGKYFLYLLLLLLVIENVTAQNNTPPVYAIKTDTNITQQLNAGYWQLLEDKSGKWTIAQVSREPLTNKFHWHDTVLKGVDTLVNTYWIRYRLKNEMDKETKIALQASAEREDFYVRSPVSGWKHFVTGFIVPWEKKDGLKANNSIPVVLQPEEEVTIYRRVNYHKPGIPSDFSVTFSNTEKLIKQDYIDYVDSRTAIYVATNLQECFMEGLLVLAVFYNLAFYSLTREQEYLYFSLFLFSEAIFRTMNSAGIDLYWYHPQYFQYVPYIGLFYSSLVFFLVQFIRTYFKTSLFYKRWDWFLFVISLIAGQIHFIFIFVDPFYAFDNTASPVLSSIFNLLFSIVYLSCLLTLFLFIGKNSRSAKLVIIGGAPLLFFWGISSLSASQILGDFMNLGTLYRPIELSCILWFVLFFSVLLFMRFNWLRKENAQQALNNERLAKEKEMERSLLIEQQKQVLEQQVTQRTAELQQSLQELKSTQSQLIQSEKMASLGQLTAGIAHEIQNPLNFVNNFSEINTELIEELKHELVADNKEEALLIAEDIKDNEQKIIHHGKRADSIVKGMLQHSRASTSKRELTDINALVDECLRLSYHGLRAKDKNFNAEIKKDLDERIGKINIVPQDISRVLLNLLNNAFYSVNEKKSKLNGTFEPAVSVSTKQLDGKVEIAVKDNGTGIPQSIINKIFQPFFTTKPTGQGTGLGLSLSYDIIKAHGGEISVKTKEGEGAEMIITIPVQ